MKSIKLTGKAQLQALRLIDQFNDYNAQIEDLRKRAEVLTGQHSVAVDKLWRELCALIGQEYDNFRWALDARYLTEHGLIFALKQSLEGEDDQSQDNIPPPGMLN